MTATVEGQAALAELLRRIADDIEFNLLAEPPYITPVGVGPDWHVRVQLVYRSPSKPLPGVTTIKPVADDEEKTRNIRFGVPDDDEPAE